MPIMNNKFVALLLKMVVFPKCRKYHLQLKILLTN